MYCMQRYKAVQLGRMYVPPSPELRVTQASGMAQSCSLCMPALPSFHNYVQPYIVAHIA
jgi:hypothetical protein